MALTCDYLLSILGLTDETLLTETIVTPRQRINSPELWAWGVSNETVINERPDRCIRAGSPNSYPLGQEEERA
jgi:hypothetical protein